MAPELGELSPSIVADATLAPEGARRIGWARANMPVVGSVRDELAAERPLEGRRIGMCLHVESKTAVLVETLVAGGAEIVWTGSPATTDDSVAAAIAENDAVVLYAEKADTADTHRDHVERVLASDPDLLLDNGADLIAGSAAREGSRVVAATEETTSGRNRLTGELAGRVPFPVVVINDSPVKQLFENEHGIGPAVVDGFQRATNSLISGKTFAVVGFGSCGRSLARTLRALNANVLVVELDEVRALEAAFEGMRVTTLERAAELADVVITVTGRPGIVQQEHLAHLRDGVMLANVGHFGTEIDVAALAELATERRLLREHVEEFVLPDGKRIRLLARGEMLNLTAATGHQIQVMDLGFALQAHAMRLLAGEAERFEPGYNPVPDEVTRSVARRALGSLSGVEL